MGTTNNNNDSVIDIMKERNEQTLSDIENLQNINFKRIYLRIIYIIIPLYYLYFYYYWFILINYYVFFIDISLNVSFYKPPLKFILIKQRI